MRKTTSIIICAASAMLFCSIALSTETSYKELGGPERQDQSVQGQLKRTVEAGGWLIDAAGTQYLILNAARYENEPWFQEGRTVKAAGRVKRDVATIYMQGIPFEARTMQPVRGAGKERVVTVKPESVAPGESIQLSVDGFPARTSVAIGLGLVESEYDVVQRSRTTARGTLNTTVRIPRYADAGRKWVAVVSTGSGRSLEKTVSNEFVIAGRDDRSRGGEVSHHTYLIRSGDTLFGIARRFGVTIQQILSLNSQIADPDTIYTGRELKIPGTSDQ